jgi:hypothetical protein
VRTGFRGAATGEWQEPKNPLPSKDTATAGSTTPARAKSGEDITTIVLKQIIAERVHHG